MCKITVFTATFNRINLLCNLYKSLQRQTKFDFEWLIIDDDSQDNTEKEVANWIYEENKFHIRYIKQEHGGKHRALNKGFILAQGEYFFIVDSDDYLVEDAIENVINWVKTIEGDDHLVGVSGLKATSRGIVGGEPLIPKDGWIDASNFERYKYKLDLDKAEVYRTEVLKKYPFPEYNNEYFITESICWNEISKDGYKLRWFPKIIYMCEYLDDGLTKSGANSFNGYINNYYGFCFLIRQTIEIFGAINQPRLVYNYFKVARIKEKNIKDIKKDIQLNNCELMYNLVCILLGFIISGFKILKDKGLKEFIKRIIKG